MPFDPLGAVEPHVLAEPWTLVGLHASVRFTLVAEASPGLLSRLLQPFARRDLTPDSLESVRSGDDLRVELWMHAMPAEMVHVVEGNLRQVVGVRSVTRRQEITGSVRRRAA
jgi:acetolactate synthase small subunit